MKTLTIDADNNITAHDSAEEAIAGADRFTSEAELNKLAATWPAERLVEIWNSLPGATTVKKFKDRKTAARRIWKAIAGLGEPAAPTKAPAAPQKPDVASAKAKSGKKGQQGESGAQKPEKGQGCAYWFEDRSHPGFAATEGRCELGRDYEDYWLAGPQRTRIHQRHSRQEDGLDGCVRQGGGRIADLLAESLTDIASASFRRRGLASAAFSLSALLFQELQFPRPI
jgi:hypothetical protein